VPTVRIDQSFPSESPGFPVVDEAMQVFPIGRYEVAFASELAAEASYQPRAQSALISNSLC